MNLTQARQAVADALNTVDFIQATPRPSKAAQKAGDAWVVVRRLSPEDFSSCSAALEAVIILGSDERKAEETFESIAVDVVNAVTKTDGLDVSDVALEPVDLVLVGGTGSLYALTVSLTVEVEP